MSDGDRHERLPHSLGAPLWIAVAISFVVVVFLIGDKLGVHSGRDQVTAREHYERVKQDELGTCIGMDGPAARKCVIDAIESAKEQSDSRQDLYAQQDMAKFTFWMAIISAVGVTITAIGVFYVARTLQEARTTTTAAILAADEAGKTTVAAIASADATVIAANAAKESNKLAREQFHAGFKPWIIVEVHGPFVVNLGDGKILMNFAEGERPERLVRLQAEVYVHCVGDIPAILDGFELRLAEGPEWPYQTLQDDRTEMRDLFALIPVKGKVPIDRRRGVSGEFSSFASIVLTPENRDCFMMNPPPVLGKVLYSDPLGNKYEHRFAFVASPTWGNTFRRWGGKEYNGE